MRRFILFLGLTLFALTLIWACGKPEAPAPEQSRKEAARLQVYDEPGIPITAGYPEAMIVEEGCAMCLMALQLQRVLHHRLRIAKIDLSPEQVIVDFFGNRGEWQTDVASEGSVTHA